MKVLIVGGGIGGLALAHGLHKAGVPVQLFEQQVCHNGIIVAIIHFNHILYRLTRPKTLLDMASISIAAVARH